VSRLQRWLVATGVLVLVLIALVTVGPLNTEAQLRRAAEEMNADCPQQVDEITVLEEVAFVEPGALVYRHRITTDIDFADEDIRSAFVSDMRQGIAEEVRKQEGLVRAIEAGVTLRYIYAFAGSIEPIEMAFDAEDFDS